MQTRRLDMIIRHIDAKTVADIGTDHAYVPVNIIKKGLAEVVIATDINKGPLESARKNVIKNELQDKIILRLGDGVTPIKSGECDNIIIAGMGGELIVNILKTGEEICKTCKKLLLQPMNAQEYVRKYLLDNGYIIQEEDIEVEGFKVYNLIIACKGNNKTKYDDFFYQIPSYLVTHIYFDQLVKKKKREFEKILSGLLKAKEKNKELIDKYNEFLQRINQKKF